MSTIRPDDPLGRAFRAGLRRELPGWVEDGLVEPDAAAQLRTRYDLDTEGTNLAATAIYGLGAVLIFGGIVSCVGWNWDGLPELLKLGLLLALTAALYAGGLWLWLKKATWPRLGHTLCVLGALVVGADIVQAAETFGLGSDGPTGFYVWGALVTVAAWVLRSKPSGLVAIGVVLVGALTQLDAHSSGLRAGDTNWVQPFIVAAHYALLAWRLRSPMLLGAGAASLGIVAAATAEDASHDDSVIVVVLVVLSVLLLTFSLGRKRRDPYGTWARVLGMAGYVVIAYMASFHDVADDMHIRGLGDESFWWLTYTVPMFVAALGFGIHAIWRDRRVVFDRPAELIAGIGGIVLLDTLTLIEAETWGAVAANVGLLLVALAAITTAARTLTRGPFWFGVLLASVLGLTRFAEFNAHELVTAAAFIGCGVAVILFGVLFERRRKAAQERERNPPPKDED